MDYVTPNPLVTRLSINQYGAFRVISNLVNYSLLRRYYILLNKIKTMSDNTEKGKCH